MSTFNVHEWNLKRRLAALNEAEVDAQGNLVDFGGGDWKSQVDEYDHIHFFIEPQMADQLEDKLIMAGIDMVDNYPYKGAHILRVSLGSNAAADLVKAEKIVGQSAKKGSPENLGENLSENELHRTAFQKLADAYEIAEDTNMFDRIEMVMFTKLMNKAYTIATGKDSSINPYGDVDNG